MTETPILAVYMVTYNHQDYIDQAIESVLNQETNFNFQLFIGDDASTDETYSRCLAWQSKFPDKIILLDASVNLGIFKNASRIFNACILSGAKYIALLEGDDFWSDSTKLQKQVDILESDDCIAGSYHNTAFLYSDGQTKPMKKALPTTLTLQEVITKYAPFHTSSFVFRAKHFCRPTWFQKIDSVDLAMYVWHAQFGNFVGINQVMSTYRIHGSSLTASDSHRVNFDDKRVILHRMMQGKVEHQLFGQYQRLIQFHEDHSKGVWRTELSRSVVVFSNRIDEQSLDMKNFIMSIDAEIINCFLDGHNRLRIRDRSYQLINNGHIWNRFQWRRLLRNNALNVLEYIIFKREEDFKLFNTLIRGIPFKAILLFSIEPSLLSSAHHGAEGLISVDWANMNTQAKDEFIRELNCGSLNKWT